MKLSPALIFGIMVLALQVTSCGKKTQETKPIRKDVVETVFASGMLDVDKSYNLAAEADGYLAGVSFEEGDSLHTGTALGYIKNEEAQFNQESAEDLFNIAEKNTRHSAPAIQQAQNSIGTKKQKMDQEYIDVIRYRKLWDNNAIARVDLEKAELDYKTAKEEYDNAVENLKEVKQQAEEEVISKKATKKVNDLITSKNRVTVTAGGRILKLYKKNGDYVKRGETVALVGNPASIYAKVNVDEANIQKVKVGQEVAIQLNTDMKKVYKGVVKDVSPSFDEASQSFICNIAFTDNLEFRIAGTQLQSNIIVATTKNALLIPRNYIDYGGHVQIKGQKGRTKIETKFVSNEWVQVLSGIGDNTILETEDLPENKHSGGDFKG